MANNTAKSVTLKDKNTNEFLYPYTSDSLVKRTNSTYETVKDALDALEVGGAATNRAYDNTKNVQGYMVLNPGTSSASVASQLQGKDNCIIEIRDIIDLGGSTLNIPSNCTLRFIGGKITNGTLVLTDTLIDDASQNGNIFEDVALSGTLLNDTVVLDWFGKEISGTTLIDASELGKPMSTIDEVTCVLTENTEFQNLHFKDAELVFDANAKYLVPKSGVLCNYIIENSTLKRLASQPSDHLVKKQAYFTESPIHFNDIIIKDSKIERLGFCIRHYQNASRNDNVDVNTFGIETFILNNSEFIGDNVNYVNDASLRGIYLAHTPVHKVFSIENCRFLTFAVPVFIHIPNRDYPSGATTAQKAIVNDFFANVLNSYCAYSFVGNYFNVGTYNLDDYVCGIAVEGKEANITDNVFENIYNSNTSGSAAVAYDIYASVIHLAYERNHIKNLACVSRCVLFKSKGMTYTTIGSRVIKQNRYTWDADWMTERGYGLRNEGQENEEFVPVNIQWLEMDCANATGEIAYNRIQGADYVNLRGANSCQFANLDFHDNYVAIKSSTSHGSGSGAGAYLFTCARNASVTQPSSWKIYNNYFSLNSDNRNSIPFFGFSASGKGIDELVVTGNKFNFKEYITAQSSASLGKLVCHSNSHDFQYPYSTNATGSASLSAKEVILDTVVPQSTETAICYYLSSGQEKVDARVTSKVCESSNFTFDLFKQSTVFNADYLVTYGINRILVHINSGIVSTYNLSTKESSSGTMVVDNLTVTTDSSKLVVRLSTDTEETVALQKIENPLSYLWTSGTDSEKPNIAILDGNYSYYNNSIGKTIHLASMSSYEALCFKAKVTRLTNSYDLQLGEFVSMDAVDDTHHYYYFKNPCKDNGYSYTWKKPAQSSSILFTNYCKGTNSDDAEFVPVIPAQEKSVTVTTVAQSTLSGIISAPDPVTYPYIQIMYSSENTSNYFEITDVEPVRWVDENGFTPALSKGITDNRPSNLTMNDEGFLYFDTSIGKYIYWGGTSWLNIDGTALT